MFPRGSSGWTHPLYQDVSSLTDVICSKSSSKSSSSKRDDKASSTAGENGSVTYATEIDLGYSVQEGEWTDQNTQEYSSYSYSDMDFAYIGSQFNYK